MKPFNFKQFSLNHHNSTMKVGTDAILLGVWCTVFDNEKALDIGTGSGVIAMIIASRSNCYVDAIEIDISELKIGMFIYIKDLKSDLFKGIKENEFMYLIHSFYAEHCKETIAATDYGLNYASALRHNNFYGVQFHPEKSGLKGEVLLKNFLEL